MKSIVYLLTVISLILGISIVALAAEEVESTEKTVINLEDFPLPESKANNIFTGEKVCISVDCGGKIEPVSICFHMTHEELNDFNKLVSDLCAPYIPPWLLNIINPGGPVSHPATKFIHEKAIQKKTAPKSIIKR
ncbi:MAG: hypothetical protein ABH871_01040 [Pseudomonadota bacterium]